MDLVATANIGYLVAIYHLSDDLSVFCYCSNRNIRNIEKLLTFRRVHVAHEVLHGF